MCSRWVTWWCLSRTSNSKVEDDKERFSWFFVIFSKTWLNVNVLRLCWTQNEPDSLKQSNTVWLMPNESFKRVIIIYSNVDHLRIGVELGHVRLSRGPIPLTRCQVKLNSTIWYNFYILKTFCANTNFQNYLNIGDHSNADHMITSVSFKTHLVRTNRSDFKNL